MKNICLSLACCLVFLSAHSQRLLSWTPNFPTENGSLSFTVDCTKGNRGLFNFEGGSSNNVYVHVGVITNLSTGPTDWKYTKFTWGTADPLAHATALGSNKYSYTISNIRSFFGVPAGETIKKVTVIFRSADGNQKQVNSDNSDMYIPVYNSYAVRIDLPVSEPRYIPWVEPINATVGSTIPVTGNSSANAALTLSLNGTTFATATAAQTISGNAVISAGCNQIIRLLGNDGTTTARDSILFYIPPTTVVAPLPANVKDGINYDADPTKVTLVLYAPGKTTATVIGDFSAWASNCTYQMNRTPDGNRFFITLSGLTSGQLYRFQYVVDGTIKIADPYTELVLDPQDDNTIPATTYPNLPAYPTGSTTGIVSTFQTNQPAYNWTATNYTRPDKRSLVIYELLLRDFLTNSNWQTLTDTLPYFKKLGINAIELMPFNEFEGNSSWGYNPDFFFAPDKAYGTKDKLKQFIDEAHKNGIAVIMDAVLNHATGQSPLAQLYWDAANNRPAANSPYFNVTPTHPFNVFNDFNHESEATKYHTARFIRHWLTEYKLDGFRWDLSKGFTQRVCSDVNCWNAYDASRVATWQRYYDSTQSVSEGSYQILEHLGNDDEESDLANRGMMLWGIMNYPFNQNTMGYSTDADISRAYYANRAGWTKPHLVTYAESHDEERIMYKNKTFGNSASGTHDVKNITVGLKRTEAMQPFLLLMPGPKMMWEFGELGYDHSIFECTNGTVPTPYGNGSCKLEPKPNGWSLLADPVRVRLKDVVSALNKLRLAKPNAFISGTMTGSLGNNLVKSFSVTHPDLSVVVAGNFEVTPQTVQVTFPAAGTWYDYIDGGTITTTTSPYTINLPAGAYKVYINQPIASGLEQPVPTPTPTPTPSGVPSKDGLGVYVYPTPLTNGALLKYVTPASGLVTIKLYNFAGQLVSTMVSVNQTAGTYTQPFSRAVGTLAAGIYVLRIEQNGKSFTYPFFKNKP